MIKGCLTERIPGQVLTTQIGEMVGTPPQLVSLSAAAALVRKLIPHAERKVRSLKRVPSGIQTSTHPGISYADQLSVVPRYFFSNLTTIRELQREAHEDCAAATQSGIPSSTYNHP